MADSTCPGDPLLNKSAVLILGGMSGVKGKHDYQQGMGSFIGFVQDLTLDATLDAQEA